MDPGNGPSEREILPQWSRVIQLWRTIEGSARPQPKQNFPAVDVRAWSFLKLNPRADGHRGENLLSRNLGDPSAIAAYLAQFTLASDDGSGGRDARYAGLSAEDLDQRRQDYRQALLWAQTTDFSEEDIRTSRRYATPVLVPVLVTVARTCRWLLVVGRLPCAVVDDVLVRFDPRVPFADASESQ